VAIGLSTACSGGASNALTAASPVSPTTASPTIQGACRTIADNSGPLLLKNDLSGPDTFCLRFDGGSGELDCQGHDVQSISLSNVHGLTIRNCRMRTLSETRSSDVTFTGNVVTADSRKTTGAVVRLSDGSGNRIIQNTLDGGWRGQPSPLGGYPPGADDGILLENEGTTVIEDNTIANVWDCGIERTGNRTDSVAIRDNAITNAAECGIGSWFAAGWQNSLIAGNVVSNSGVFAEFFYSTTQNKGVDHITLRDNVFEGNRFENPSRGALPSVNVDYVSGIVRLPLDIANNVFRNNDFGSAIPAPRLAPAYGFVDGGSNICRQDAKSTLTCAR
jgi:hypothetical protein